MTKYVSAVRFVVKQDMGNAFKEVSKNTQNDGMLDSYFIETGKRTFMWVGIVESEQHLIDAKELSLQREQLKGRLAANATHPCQTADGMRVPILANIESPRDFNFFNTDTVAGVGLFRTEFMYMDADGFPSVEHQENIYREVLKEFEGRRVVFRTLDVGNDKQL